MAIDYRAELNDSQYRAVVCCDVPSLVIAGAGSGKTRVLTYKIAYLLEHKYAPENILALTFTNKAAREMRERISTLVGYETARYLWMGTFHSIFARILRDECDIIGYQRDYTIYDEQDSLSIVKHIVKELGLDDKRYKPGTVLQRIGEAKNNMLRSRDYSTSKSASIRDKAAHTEEIHHIYSIYEKRLRESNAMDFDDLLLNTYFLFAEHPDVRRRYQDVFQYVLVDEYQDTNRVQHEIVKLLTARCHRVCVVGDDAQSIYSFRGAEVDNILSFQHLYKGTKLFKLERNYRSTRTIVAAANCLIANNKRQIRKDIYSVKAEGEPIEVCEAYSDREEAAIVAHRANALRRRNGLSWNDFAVLYRTNNQSRTFEEEFRKQGLPYHIVGGMSFYQRKEVKDAVAYMRLAVNLSDEASLTRIINVPARGIGQTTVRKFTQCAYDNDVPMWEVVSHPDRFSLDINNATIGRLWKFASMMEAAHEMALKEDAHEVSQYIIKNSGLWAEVFSSHELENIGRQQNLQELVNGIASFVTEAREQGEGTSLADYLQNISLLSDTDNAADNNEEKITLMTMHSAKGLEFKVVFVVGMEEGLFPSDMAFSHSDLEEERRLFYVAMTRAEERLFLTWSHTRMRYGQFESNEKSRFLAEIDKKFISVPKRHLSTSPSKRLWQPDSTQRNTPPAKPIAKETAEQTSPYADSLHIGDRVEHARFGIGTIRSFEGAGLDSKATVDFEHTGEKRLLLRFAKLTLIDK